MVFVIKQRIHKPAGRLPADTICYRPAAKFNAGYRPADLFFAGRLPAEKSWPVPISSLRRYLLMYCLHGSKVATNAIGIFYTETIAHSIQRHFGGCFSQSMGFYLWNYSQTVSSLTPNYYRHLALYLYVHKNRKFLFINQSEKYSSINFITFFFVSLDPCAFPNCLCVGLWLFQW